MGIVLGWSALLLFAGVPIWLYLGLKGIKKRTAVYAALLAAGPIYLALF